VDTLKILTVKGIKCDHCDWRNLTVERADYKDWLNRPCPKCGANLLTQADYDAVCDLEKIAANPLIKLIALFARDKRKTRVNMNGTGWEGMTLEPADK
jgi:phage FluMu protein Com